MIQLENRWADLGEIWDLSQTRTSKFSTISNTSMADEQSCEMGWTLAPLALGPYNDVWLQIFGKQKNLV
jgi:hypothetical protein